MLVGAKGTGQIKNNSRAFNGLSDTSGHILRDIAFPTAVTITGEFSYQFNG
jgi:hypothetical protein